MGKSKGGNIRRKSISFNMEDERQALAYQIINEKPRNVAASFVTDAILRLEGAKLEKIRQLLVSGNTLGFVQSSKVVTYDNDLDDKKTDIKITNKVETDSKTDYLDNIDEEIEDNSAMREVRSKNLNVMLGLRK